MPLCLSAILCLTVYLTRRPFPAQGKESVFCDPLFKRLKPITRMIDVPKKLGVLEPFVEIHLFIPLGLVRYPLLIESGIIAIPPWCHQSVATSLTHGGTYVPVDHVHISVAKYNLSHVIQTMV